MIDRRELPAGWDADIQPFPADAKGMASRASSGKVLNQAAQRIPWLLGGSADLAPSTNTLLKFDGAGDFEAGQYGGRNFHFGIREHAMGAICNGMSLCGLRAYGATFFVFTDYMRPSIRLAAIMGLPVFYVFTHDSIGVGEDGPTHQPIEHLAALRAIPNLLVIRPADANEVAEAYRVILPLKNQPAALVLTRQNLPTLDRAKYASAEGLRRGGYVLADAPDGQPEVILIGTGSEVSLCLAAYEKLSGRGHQGPRGEHALLGTVRRPAGRISRRRSAAGGHAAGGRRVGRQAGLGEIHRPARPVHRHVRLRRLGPGRRAAEAFRLHGRERRGRGKETVGGVGQFLTLDSGAKKSINPDPNTEIRSLIDRWCDRKELRALARLLPAWLANNGLTDGREMLRDALKHTYAACNHLPADERDTLKRLYVLVDAALRDRQSHSTPPSAAVPTLPAD